uniref:Enterochelin esterase n=1 Tax=Acidobacterium capsulatum TaxID=33075 RepID=A0A7V4XRZ4_9BACT
MRFSHVVSTIATGACAALLSAGVLASTAAAQMPRHLFFRVSAGSALHQPVSGRLLVFIAKGTGAKQVSINEFEPNATWVAAREVHDLAPGASVDIDTDQIAFPKPFSDLTPGDYQVQAVLDVDHTYNYSGLTPGDLMSPVLTLTHWTPGEGAEPALVLDHVVPPIQHPALSAADQDALDHHMQLAAHQSRLLTEFSGRPTSIRAWVVLPPGYHKGKRKHYPTVYWTHGFGGNLYYCERMGIDLYRRMAEGKMPPMIWVMLDEHLATGTHEFDNSVNNGPWGSALVEEYIPWLESQYRMDARPSGRFLQGHSSGGWASLQLEVDYPRFFGGTWSTSPDPSTFHDFTGIDLYAPHANVYHRPDGTPYPLVRAHGKVLATFEQFAKLEQVLGPYGGQIASFEWVFSPRGPNGKPEPMFDRTTGDVYPKVVAYWREHYDLAHIVKTTWPEQGRYLKGHIHVYVGTADTFYLNGAARKFDAVLQKLDAEEHFTFRKGRSHFNLYEKNGDRMALFDTIAAQMYLEARPHAGAKWKAVAAEEYP